jgi:hypothetical protein
MKYFFVCSKPPKRGWESKVSQFLFGGTIQHYFNVRAGIYVPQIIKFFIWDQLKQTKNG